jgi:Helix-turn-helix domain
VAISVTNWVWTHSRSRHGARLVLLAVADYMSSPDAWAWPSNRELCRKTNLTERAVRLAVAELVELGELAVAVNSGPGGCNRYRVLAAPQDEGGQKLPPGKNYPPKNRSAWASVQIGSQAPAKITPPAKNAPGQNLPGGGADSAPGTVNEPKPSTQNAGATPSGLHELPDDFKVTDAMRRWAHKTHPGLDIDFETEQFCRYWRGEGRRKKSWVDAWQKWIGDAWKRMQKPASANGHGKPAGRPVKQTNYSDEEYHGGWG